jgi:superfamily II DNA or RNA helicase
LNEQVEGWAHKHQKRRPVLITSYEMVRRFSKELAEAHPGLLICDEAHRLKKVKGI